MPCYNSRCTACDWQAERFEKIDEYPPCPTCGGQTEHVWVMKAAAAVIQDEFPEPLGFTPYDQHLMNTGRAAEATIMRSHSERRRIMKERGLREAIDHVPDNRETDKSRHTTRWDAAAPRYIVDPHAEEERKRLWWEDEQRFQAARPPHDAAIITPNAADAGALDTADAPLDFKKSLNALLP